MLTYRRNLKKLRGLLHGGGHERGMRSGTLPVHQIVGMGEAYRIAKEEMATEMERLRGLRNRLWNGIKDIEEVYLNGDLEHGAPNILNVSFNYVEGESLIMALFALRCVRAVYDVHTAHRYLSGHRFCDRRKTSGQLSTGSGR